MQLHDLVGRKPRGLVQIVDVLRDDRRDFPKTVQGCQRQMAAAGPCCGKLLVHGEAPAPGFPSHFGTFHEFIERNGVIFRPQAAR